MTEKYLKVSFFQLSHCGKQTELTVPPSYCMSQHHISGLCKAPSAVAWSALSLSKPYCQTLGFVLEKRMYHCRAGKDLAEMILKSNIQRGMPFLKQVMRNPSEKRRRKQAADIPAPSLPYPWEAFSKEDLDAESKDVKFE